MNFNPLSKGLPLGLTTLATAVAAALAALILVFQTPTVQANAGATEPPAMPVSVAEVLQKDIDLWDEFSGRLEAVQRVDVRPRVAGTVEPSFATLSTARTSPRLLPAVAVFTRSVSAPSPVLNGILRIAFSVASTEPSVFNPIVTVTRTGSLPCAFNFSYVR